MNKVRCTINVSVTLLFTTFLAVAAQAQATRTWVSGVGDDANPCSRTAPCKTFAGAISKTAAGGEINVLDPGGFGAVTITKSITIDGSGGSIAGVLVSGTNAIIINAGVNDVVNLRNLDIDGIGTGLNGIRILAAKAVYVERCLIYSFRSATAGNGRGISDERNVVGAQLFVTDTIISNNVAGGVVVINPSGANNTTASLNNVRLEGNGSGVVASNDSRVTISNSVVAANTADGLIVAGSGGAAELNVENCVVVGNGNGVTAQSGGTVRLSNAHIANNATGVSGGGGAFVTYGNNKIGGNAAGNSLAAVGASTISVQ